MFLIIFILLTLSVLANPRCKSACGKSSICYASCRVVQINRVDFLKDGYCNTKKTCKELAVSSCLVACGWFKLGRECKRGCQMIS